MAATRVYSTAAYWVAAAVAIALSLCPKVGAAISAIPPGVLGGATIVLYGLVGILGVRIWLTNHVDFSQPVNQMTAAIPLIIGIADFTWHAGILTFTGIALGSIAALVVYHGMRLLGFRKSRGRPLRIADSRTSCRRPAPPSPHYGVPLCRWSCGGTPLASADCLRVRADRERHRLTRHRERRRGRCWRSCRRASR